MRPDAIVCAKFCYRIVPGSEVSPARRRIVDEVMSWAINRFALPCPRPRVVWFREGDALDFDFIETSPMTGQAVIPWTKGDKAIELRLSAELRSVDEIVRTVAHEMRHVYRMAHWRPPTTDAEVAALEQDAEAFEEIASAAWIDTHGASIGEEANMLALKWWSGEQQ